MTNETAAALAEIDAEYAEYIRQAIASLEAQRDTLKAEILDRKA